MTKPSLAEFVPLAFIEETGSVIKWFKMPKEERINWWKLFHRGRPQGHYRTP